MADNEDTGENMKVNAAKGKLRWSLLNWRFVRQMAEVMEHGTEKHAPNDWQQPTPYSLYFDAMHRHISAWYSGETLDPDSGKHHLTHAACCAMILVWYHYMGVGIDDRPGLQSNAKIPERRKQKGWVSDRADYDPMQDSRFVEVRHDDPKLGRR